MYKYLDWNRLFTPFVQSRQIYVRKSKYNIYTIQPFMARDERLYYVKGDIITLTPKETPDSKITAKITKRIYNGYDLDNGMYLVVKPVGELSELSDMAGNQKYTISEITKQMSPTKKHRTTGGKTKKSKRKHRRKTHRQ